MNRRQLFLSTSKAALATAFGGAWLAGKAVAQTGGTAPAAPAAGSTPARGQTGANIGSPDGTRTIPGDVLPAPDLPFGGTINLNADRSKSWWPPRIVPPAG